jgi:CHAD domain-containing protein
LHKQYRRLAKKFSVKRVHDFRTALRRLVTVWSVLNCEDISSEKFEKRTIKPLKKINTVLGKVRDLDVCLKLAEEIGVSKDLRLQWTKKRNKLAKKAKRLVGKLDLSKILAHSRKVMLKQAQECAFTHMASVSASSVSSRQYLSSILVSHEAEVRKLADAAKSIRELHSLRLALKKWRYLLSEFFGLNSIKLVETQAHLGRINDYSRLIEILEKYPDESETIVKIEAQKAVLILGVSTLLKDLPYGLRPSSYADTQIPIMPKLIEQLNANELN